MQDVSDKLTPVACSQNDPLTCGSNDHDRRICPSKNLRHLCLLLCLEAAFRISKKTSQVGKAKWADIYSWAASATCGRLRLDVY